MDNRPDERISTLSLAVVRLAVLNRIKQPVLPQNYICTAGTGHASSARESDESIGGSSGPRLL